MDKTTIGLIVAVTAMVLGWIWTAIRLAQISGEYRVKIDTMWELTLRRGEIEGVKKGVFTVNSPVYLSPFARRQFEGLAEDLREFYQKLPAGMLDKDVAPLIESKFGDRLVKEICIPLSIYNAACLVAAIAVAKEPSSTGNDKCADIFLGEAEAASKPPMSKPIFSRTTLASDVNASSGTFDN